MEFLQFLTSWKMNQKTMMEFCKWPGVVINTPYTGFLKALKPDAGDARRSIQSPFLFNSKSRTQLLEHIEQMIIEQPENAKLFFAKGALKNVPALKDEFYNAISDYERQLFDMEGNRAVISAGLLRSDLSKKERENQNERALMAAEMLVSRELDLKRTIAAYNSMDKITEQLRDYIRDNEKRSK